jgi:DNA modification methylase
MFPEINKIYTADCIEFMRTLPDKSVDLVLTDPPYGIGIDYDTYSDTEDEWFKLMGKALPEIIRVSTMAILPSCKIARMKWIYDNFPPDWLIIWYKGSTGHRSFVGFNDYEPHLVYGKNKGVVMHDFFQTKPSPKKGTFNHPVPKPIEWADWIISRASKPGNLILDPFVGSGTTCVSAKNLGRNYIGVDISPSYCAIAEERLNATTGTS